jgi:hypothetical protein
MMLYLVEYDKGYHTDQLEPMVTIFAWRTVSQIWRDFAGRPEKSKPPLSIIIDGPIIHQNHGRPSQEDGGEAKEDQVSRAVQYISAVMIFLALNFAFLLKSLHSHGNRLIVCSFSRKK